MLRIALKMLVGDRAKYFGILVGLTFASLLITQQAAIFVGLMTRTYGFITDTGQAQLWVMDPNVQYVDDIKPLSDTELFRVRGVEGVAWAEPMYKGLLRARLADGNLQMITVIGIDDTTLMGGPPNMIEGNLADLRLKDAVIIDLTEAKDKLVVPGPNGTPVPLGVGDAMEINDHRAVIVGTSENSPTFRSQPMVYTTYSRALQFAPPERKLLTYILVGVKPGQSEEEVAERIERSTELKALTPKQFKQSTYDYYMTHTGIPVNFGTAVLLGFVVGIAIAGQMFYQFTIDNLRYFGTLKAMGASNRLILKMIVLQSLAAGVIGYGLGVGLAALAGLLLQQTSLSFRIPWLLMGFTAIAVLLICIFSALISVRKVFKLEPGIVFR